MGPYLAFLIIPLVAMVGIWNIHIGIMMTIVALGISVVMGMLVISIGAFMGIVFAGLVIILRGGKG